jgi:resuscitation-promoting factor RpfB
VGGALRVFLTLALAVAGGGYLAAEKKVTLADEGRSRTVSTFAPTVASALGRQGIRVGPDDRVDPPLTAPVTRHIEVRRAKDVLLVLGDQRKVVRVTGKTVSEVLHEASVPAKGAYVEPSLDTRVASGEEIVVSQPAQVQVVHDGVSQPVVTNALTAGGLLRQMGIQLGPLDRVEPSIVTNPATVGTINVVRVSEAISRTFSPISFKSVTRRSDAVEFGVRRVVQEGADGALARTYRATYENGRPKTKRFVGTSVARPPQDKVTLVGTRFPAFVSHGHSAEGTASWFGTSGLSSAHQSLPFGTVVKVTNLDNGRSTTVVIRDRGPYSGGRVIDLSDAAFSQLSPVTRGVVRVKLEW